MVSGSPCMCIATQPTLPSAATCHNEAEMSLTSVAPAATAASATAALRVSMETRTWRGQGRDHVDDPAPLLGLIDRLGPGRVLSPPTSTTSAPSATS